MGVPATSAGRGLGIAKLDISERNATHAFIVFCRGSLDFECHILPMRVPSRAKPGKGWPILPHSWRHSQ